MKPAGFQLSRRAGWRMPQGGVSVARPGRFGNPFTVTTKFPYGHQFAGAAAQYIAVPTVEEAVAAFEESISIDLRFQAEIVEKLQGKHLGCWCKLGSPCHRDVLLRWANP